MGWELGGSSAASASSSVTAMLAIEEDPQVPSVRSYGVHGRAGADDWIGDWEFGLTDNTNAAPQQQGQFQWVDGKSEDFIFSVAPGNVATFTIGENTRARTVTATYADAVVPDSIFIWAKATASGAAVELSDLKLAGKDVDGVISVAADAGVFSTVRVVGAELSGAWSLTGKARMTVGSGGGSEPQFHIVARKVVPPVNLVAHRTGGNLGQEVSEALEDAGDPASYLILTNNDYEEPLNPNDPDDGGRDYDDLQATIPWGSSGDDDDLARITLKQINQPLAGSTIRIELSDPTAIRLFNADGSLFYDYATTGPSPLALSAAALASGDMDLWLEGLHADTNFALAMVYLTPNGMEICRDDVHVTLGKMTYVGLDGNELDTVETVPMQQLLDLANEVTPTAPIPDSAYFRVRMDGVSRGMVTEVEVTSSEVPSDFYLDSPDGGTSFQSLYPAVIYSAGPDECLSESDRLLIRQRLGINAVHNQVAPNVRATTGPASDVHNRKGPAPGWSTVLDQAEPYDLILFLANDLDFAREAGLYAAAHNSRFERPATPQAMANAIIARSNALNRKIRVLLVGHGNKDEGPAVGGGDGGAGEGWTPILNPPVASIEEFEKQETLASYMDEKEGVFKTTDLARTEGKIEEIAFTACKIAATVGGQRVFDAIRARLGASKLIAGKKMMQMNFEKISGTWVTRLHASEDDTKTPVNADTPLQDVLHISSAP